MFSWLGTAWSAVSGLFGGSSSKAILWLSTVLGIALLLCWALWLRGSLAKAGANVAAMETAYTASQAAVSELKDARKRQDIALTAREAQLNTINAQRDALRRKLEEVMRDDQDFAAWAATPVPGAVPGLLQ